MPAQSSRSIGFLMLVGSSLTLCGIICNNNALLSPGFLRYDPSKSNYGLLVTIVPSVLFAFLPTNTLKSRQSLSCLCGTAEAPLGMPEATPTTHQALRGRIQTYFYGLPTLREYRQGLGDKACGGARGQNEIGLAPVHGRSCACWLP